MDTPTADRTVDARGHLCPMPIVMANREMRGMAPGEVLRILATDRGAKADFPAWAEDTGNDLLHAGEEEGALVFYIRKGEG